jgi:maltose-binding protein MalE
MKKVIILGLVTSLSIVLLSRCGGEPSPESRTGTIEKQHMTQEKVQERIKKAGEDAGWIMTEFKSNALIAEKIDGDNAIAINVKFTDSSYDINPENSELKSIIEDALN